MRYAWAAMISVALVGCSTGAGLGEARRGQDPASGASTGLTAIERASDAHTLGVLQTRDQRVTLTAAGDGLRVTVRDPKGAIVAENVKVDDLREIDPFLYEVCRSSVASNHSLDARLDRPTRPLDQPLDGRFDGLR